MTTKHRRAARITATDRDYKVVVSFEFKSGNGLILDEVREVRTKLARKIADALRELPHTDFGPEDTKVTLLRSL
jgi:hypothetical protein